MAVAMTVGAQSFTDADGASEATVGPAREFRRNYEAAVQAMRSSDFDTAEARFRAALSQDVPRAEKRNALLEMARMFEARADRIKAAAIYEQFLSLFPGDMEVPEINLRLGRMYRELGSFKAAHNKFYDVLYGALRVKDGEEYKGAAMHAQMEIANTHFEAGDYERAGQMYARLKLLELPAGAQHDVFFRAACVRFLEKDYAGALAAHREFLERYPEGALAPESQHFIVQSLRELGRNEEALAETLKLLRSGARHAGEHPEVWAYWQKKTGNALANDLYQAGDFLNALTIYQTLAEISDAPEWRWPVVYQIGLCFERLKYPERAAQAYKYIIDAPLPAEGASPAAHSAGPALATVREMAQWRSDHLRWLRETEEAVTPLFGSQAGKDDERMALNVRPEAEPQRPLPASASAPGEPPAEAPGM